MSALPVFNPDGGQPVLVAVENVGHHIHGVTPGGSSMLGWMVGQEGSANQPVVMILTPYAGQAVASGPVGQEGSAYAPAFPL